MIYERAARLVQPIEYVSLLALAVLAWILYKVMLKGVSEERHIKMRRRFARLMVMALLGVAISEALHLLQWQKTWGTFALLTIGAVTLTQLAQIYLYVILFRLSMNTGVPLLIVNLFTFLFATTVVALLASEVFGVQLGALMATSAAATLILGLALQETLGNLFSGVALQVDRPYSLGDWIEVHNGGQKWFGRVYEVNWRATVLTGLLDEHIAIPNRTIAQSQVVTLAASGRWMKRSQVFRFRFDAPEAQVRDILLASVVDVPHVLANPRPIVLITELAESFMIVKLIYALDDPGFQTVAGDVVFSRVLSATRKANIPFGEPSLSLSSQTTNER